MLEKKKTHFTNISIEMFQSKIEQYDLKILASSSSIVVRDK